jgi:hypothetical protein
VFCQTSLPYRNPGDDVLVWERLNGTAHLEVLAGKAMHPTLDRLIQLGLPFGPKPRLVLVHVNAEAVRTNSPEVEIEDSLTAFVRRLKLDPGGRNMRTIKDQLARLSAASVRLGMVRDGRAITVNSHIVSAFDLWFPKDHRQRVLWPSTVRLSLDYFESLRAHAVPLDERAIAALSHSAMALDIYAWLAQRLHRIVKPHRQLIPWVALQEQFGSNYVRIRRFREVFMVALRQVHAVYPAAKIDLSTRRAGCVPMSATHLQKRSCSPPKLGACSDRGLTHYKMKMTAKFAPTDEQRRTVRAMAALRDPAGRHCQSHRHRSQDAAPAFSRRT